MEELINYRKQIDAIDAQLILLFEQRMDLTHQVAAYKESHHLAVFHPDREREVISNAVSHLQNPAYTEDAIGFMNAIMAISRAAQQQEILPPRKTAPLAGKIGFYGAAGSFSEEALNALFGETRERLSCPEFEAVFTALQEGKIDYGVLPIENSSTGAITRVYDLLGQFGFYIVGEKYLQIRQNLVGTVDADLDSITAVYSHEQGIEQCGRFLIEHPNWKRVAFHSTSLCAKQIAAEKDRSKAAIASEHAAMLYGLKILVPAIQDCPDNTTRFIVIGREPTLQNADKISLCFSLDHQSGTLYQALRCFAERQINLVKIESRPIPQERWKERFYLDFAGKPEEQNTRDALAQIAAFSQAFQLLGTYQSDSPPAIPAKPKG